jgi:hypothetical protein
MSIQLLALVPQIYAGRKVAAGSNFIVRGESDARLLIAIGRAASVPVAPVIPVPPPVARKWTRAVVAVPIAEPEEQEEAPKPKRQYKRRDMTAEDTE